MGTLIKTQVNIKNTMEEPVNSASEIDFRFFLRIDGDNQGRGIINIKRYFRHQHHYKSRYLREKYMA